MNEPQRQTSISAHWERGKRMLLKNWRYCDEKEKTMPIILTMQKTKHPERKYPLPHLDGYKDYEVWYHETDDKVSYSCIMVGQARTIKDEAGEHIKVVLSNDALLTLAFRRLGQIIPGLVRNIPILSMMIGKFISEYQVKETQFGHQVMGKWINSKKPKWQGTWIDPEHLMDYLNKEDVK